MRRVSKCRTCSEMEVRMHVSSLGISKGKPRLGFSWDLSGFARCPLAATAHAHSSLSIHIHPPTHPEHEHVDFKIRAHVHLVSLPSQLGFLSVGMDGEVEAPVKRARS